LTEIRQGQRNRHIARVEHLEIAESEHSRARLVNDKRKWAKLPAGIDTCRRLYRSFAVPLEIVDHYNPVGASGHTEFE